VGVHGVHFVAVGVWMGGLAALLAGVRGDPDTSKAASVRRYASAAAVMVFVVAGTGTFRAFNEIESWGQLVTTSYGRAVLAKVVLLGVVAGLAAVNRYRSLPAVETDLRPLRRVSKAELTVAVVILAVTGLLSSLVPSRYDAGAAQTSSLVVQGTDFARTVAVRLEVTPGYPGANDFRAEVTDPADDAPLDADRVALRFRPPAEADLEGSTLELELVEQGTWEGTGADLSLGGVWRVVVLVGRGAGSAEVELTVATRCRTSVLRTPGQPSLHDIDLGAGAAVQAYVDPAEPGYVEVHFTFFDAGGDELPITGPLDIAAVRTDGDDVVRLETEVQRLTPGHYVGGVELTQGSWRFEVDATQQTSERFNACFEEAIG
jgi:nitrogen fixation protein FixH